MRVILMTLALICGCASDTSGGPVLSDEMCTVYGALGEAFPYRVESGQTCDCIDGGCAGELTCGDSAIAFDAEIECAAGTGIECAVEECQDRG